MKEKVHVLYLRRRREPVGALVMRQNGDVGLSLCHVPLDHFDRKRAVQIAYGRARKNNRDVLSQVKGHPRAHIALAALERYHEIQHQKGGLPLDFFNYEVEVHEKASEKRRLSHPESTT